MKIIIFGTGALYQNCKKLFVDMKIICFLDNNREKWGRNLDGIPIVPPEDIGNYDFDYIFLVSIHAIEMRAQLIKLKIPEEKIIDKGHLGVFRGINQIRRYEISEKLNTQHKGKVLLISHVLNLTGAPIVLGHLGKAFYDRGYKVEIYSQDSVHVEEVIYQLLEWRIPVSLYAFLESLDVDRVCDDYDMIVVNTITLYSIVRKLSGKEIPVIWWLHEEEDVYRSMKIGQQEIVTGDNVYVYAVGNRAKEVYMRHSNHPLIGIMPYGVREEHNEETVRMKRNKLIFALIGSCCERKGQDIVYDVMCRRGQDWNHLIEVWFIGEITDSKREIYRKIPCICCKGVVNPDDLARLYNNIDVLICPSLHDPMPVVVSEAMMHKKTCIVSDMTGQYEFITPYVDGLTCRAGDVESLEGAMGWVIENCEQLDNIGTAGYQIYKKYFSMDTFESKVDEIIDMYFPGKI